MSEMADDEGRTAESAQATIIHKPSGGRHHSLAIASHKIHAMQGESVMKIFQLIET